MTKKSLSVHELIAERDRLRVHLRQKSEQITRLQDGIEKMQQGSAERSAHEPPAVLKKQLDHWRKQCRDLQSILTGIGECISGHEGHVFDDVHALLEQSRELKPSEAARPSSSSIPDEIAECEDILRNMVNYAHETGYHENGYDVVTRLMTLLKPTPPPAPEYKIGDRVNHCGHLTEVVGVSVKYMLCGGAVVYGHDLQPYSTATKGESHG